MRGPSPQPLERERRAHPRAALEVPVTLLPVGDGRGTHCETLDVSAGGMRVRSLARIPVGAYEIVLSATTDAPLVVQGEVVEEILDASTGEVTARIMFTPVAPAVYRQLVAPPGTARRTRRTRLLVAGAAAAIVVASGFLIVDDSGEHLADVRATPGAGTEATTSLRSSPLEARPHVAPDPLTTATASVSVDTGTTAAPATPPAVAPEPAQSSAPPAAAVERTERADNLVHVILGSSSEETSVASTVGPSEGVDLVRVQLNITPEPSGTTLPVQVTLENRGEEAITFAEGFTAIVTASHSGATAGTVTLTAADITEVAPGEVVAVDGVLDFGAPGEYDVLVELDVAS